MSPNDKAARMLTVDEHPILRLGIATLIGKQKGMSICGEASNLAEAYQLVTKLSPDLVITDISLRGNSGIELMKELAYRWDSLPVLAYSAHDEQIYAERVLRAGARGYVMKQRPPEVLLQAIRHVLDGKVYLSREISDRLLGKFIGKSSRPDDQSIIDRLSDRELEVLQMIGQGQSTSQIAEQLCLSTKTVETYREHLKQKLNLSTGPELVRYAVEWSITGA